MWAWLLVGCVTDGIEIEGVEIPEETTEYTYYEDIKPILESNCVRCHQEKGLGLGDFSDPDEVVLFASNMLAAIDEGRMPPPAADPSCRDYVGSERMVFDPEDRDVLADWVNGGSPLGNEADAVEAEPVMTELADPDLTLLLAEPYTPQYADLDNPGNEYRCFVLDPEFEQTTYITAMAPIVDNPNMVHHEVLFTRERSTMTEEELSSDGYDCISSVVGANVNGIVAAWAPGMLPIQFPEGAGMAVSADDVLILQIHYYADAGSVGASDQSGYAFDLADEVDTLIYMAPLGIYDFSIPAGEESHTEGGSFENTYFDLKAYAVFPHMHQLGSYFDATVTHVDGSTTCLVEGEYDFNNQMTYQFNEPISFEVGARIDFNCTWNNSADNPHTGGDPQTTTFGERTDEEMCFFFTLVSL